MTELSIRLDGKRACVTGAAGVTGLVISRHMLDLGAEVFMLDLDAARLTELTGFLDAVAAAAEIMLSEGPVDILINNAGVLSNNKATETDPE